MNHILNRISSKPRASTGSDQSPPAKFAGIARKAAITIISTVLAVSIPVGADLYLHRKHGVNPWGYRGPAAGRKEPGEKRIAVLGGSTTWGFGLAAGQAFPNQLQQRFAERALNESGTTIRVLNLGFNNEGAYSFKYTLRDYGYLEYDVVLIYSGYNDLYGQNVTVFRHRSPVFIWTGYLPLLPALTVDKIETWVNSRSKKDKPIVFGTNDPETRKQLDQLNGSDTLDTNLSPANYGEWEFYCQQIYEATDLALKQGKRVLIVTEPYLSSRHVTQQQVLENMLTQRFAGQANLRYLNLGRSIDLQDKSLCWDGMHLTAEGNRRITEALTQPVLEMLWR